MAEHVSPLSVDIGMLIRRTPHEVFESLADPAITTRFWYTKSSGRMTEGAELVWEWEMYGASRTIRVEKSEAGKHIRFAWNNYAPSEFTTVEFSLLPYENAATYLRITESGFTGDVDTRIANVRESTAGFAFLLSGLKAALEHDVTLRLTFDEHPPNLRFR